MRDQQINTFQNGMQMDLGDTMPQEGSYTDAHNIRIISDGTEATNAIVVNVKGNKKELTLKYEFITLSYTGGPGGIFDEGTNTDSDIIEKFCTIIGHTIIKDTLVLYSVVTDPPVGFLETSLIHTVDLNTFNKEIVYESTELNFNVDYPIESIGRYESEDIQRVYWTDNLNPPRSINLINPPSNVEALNLAPLVEFSKTVITNTTDKGSLDAGMYQYCYRLSSDDGRMTRFSTLSNFGHVLDGKEYWLYSEDPEGNIEYSNTIPGEETTKALKVTINNIDPDFEYIEIAAVYSGGLNAITNASILTKQTIPDSNTITITHTNNLEGDPITIEEITSITTVPIKAKTINQKDNRLFLGNVEYAEDSLEFNAQAFRYKRDDGIKYPHSSTEDVSTYVNSPDDIEISTDNNINPYNSYFEEDTPVVDSYKFKKDGVTLGGEGPFVSYEFTKKSLEGNNSAWGLPEETPMLKGSFTSSEYCNDEDSSGDYKSPNIASNFKGYQRGEIYRFGIVLYDLQGNPGFVNWVGDIKFPSYEDFDHKAKGGIYNYTIAQNYASFSGTNYFIKNNIPSVYNTEAGASNTEIKNVSILDNYNYGDDDILTGIAESEQYDNVYSAFSYDDDAPEYAGGNLYALGIEFTVNIPNELKDKISGYSIVRVERKEEDKSVLGSGILNYLSSHNHNDVVYHYFNTGLEYKIGNGFISNESGVEFDPFNPLIDDTPFVDIPDWILEGEGAMNGAHEKVYNNMFTIDSPDFAFNNDYPSGSCVYVKINGALNGRTQSDTAVNVTHSAAVYTSHSLARQTDYLFQTYPIEFSCKFSRSQRVPVSSVPNTTQTVIDNILSATSDDGFINESWNSGNIYTTNASQKTGIGEDSLLVVVPPSFPADTPAGNVPWSRWMKNHNGSNSKSKLLASIIRNVDGAQYGGNTYNSRSKNSYISTGHFAKSNDTSPQTVWGGDIYVTMYDLEKLRIPHESLDGNAHSNKKSMNFAFPVETTINTTLRGGYHFGNKTDWSSDQNQLLNTFELDPVYSQENKTSVFIPRPFNFRQSTKQPSAIAYSNAKIDSEIIDSFKLFRPENNRVLDGSFGGIEKLINYQDTTYFLQENAFGKLLINPVSTVVDESGASIVLGTGSVIQDFNYISTNTGTQHPLSVINTDKGIYWVNEKFKKIYAFRANGLESISDVHGLKSWTHNNILPDSRLVTGNDFINNEVLFSIDNQTLVFSEMINKFTSFYSYGTDMYINTYDSLMSLSSNRSSIYRHNTGSTGTWYEEFNNSSIEFISNKNPLFSKVYDNLEWYAVGGAPGQDLFSSASFENSSNSTTVDFNNENADNYFPEKVVKEKIAKTPVPRTTGNYRFRDTYLKIKLVSTSISKVALHYVKTLFRISRR